MIDADVMLFHHVACGGSLSAGARALGLSTAVASRRLARLEARLGVRLALRTTRRLELTPQGQRFHQDVSALLAEWRQAEARVMRAAYQVSGPLRISAPTSFGRLYVAPVLKSFLDVCPQVDVSLTLSDAFVDLMDGRTDLAIRITAVVPADLDAIRLASSPRLVCAAPSYLAHYGHPQAISDLADHHILAAEGQLPWRLAQDGREIVFPGISLVRTNSSEVVRELALSGMGIALRSLWDVHRDLAAGRLVRVLPQLSGSQDVAIYALRAKAGPSPAAIERFVSHLRDTLQPHAPWETAIAP